MSYFTKRTVRVVGGALVGALALSVSPILGFTGIASADHIEVADPIGDGNVCEDAPETDPFTDVADSDAAIDEIRCMANTDPVITKGKTATTYEPLSPTQRGQMALFLTRMADLAEANETSEDAVQALPAGDGVTPFTDISDWPAEHQAAIDRLEEAGITDGVTATEFRPEAFVTRRQMARFIVNFQDYVAGTDFAPTPSEDYFDDDNGDFGEEVLNILAEEGVFIGTAGAAGVHNVQPGANITRRQMAFVVTRKLEVLFEAGLIGRLFAEDDAGCGTVTEEFGGEYTFTDSATGEQVTVEHDATNDVFTVDGAAASRGAFEAAISVGDQVCFTDDPTAGDADADQHALTNVAPSAITSGVIGNIDAGVDTFRIIEPVSGVAISDTKTYTTGIFFVDGAVANLAGFEAALNEGDTVVIESDGVNTTFRLTNQTVSGTVSDVDDVNDEVMIGNLGDDPLTAQDAAYDYVTGATTNNYFIGGVAATLAQFETALTVGDTLEYTRAGDVQTFRLTNVAPPAVTGLLTETFDTTLDTADVVVGGDTVPIDYSGSSVFRLGGVAVTEAEFEDAMTAGDNITYQPDNPDTAGDEESISLTNATLTGGLEAINTGIDEYDVINAQGEDIYDDLVYTAAVFGGIDRYFVNGAEVTLAVFEQYLDKVDADATREEVIQVVDNGDISTDHRLTTDETLP